MRKAIIRFFMKIYLKARKHWDPLIIPNKIRDEFNVDSSDFARRINAPPYKSDHLGGLIDNTSDPNTFFDAKEHERDCDDYQRMWSWWGVFNGYNVKEFVICNPTTIRGAFQTMHVIGVLEKEGRFFLTNYYMLGPFTSEDEALGYMEHFLSYKGDRTVVFYRDIKLADGIIKDI